MKKFLLLLLIGTISISCKPSLEKRLRSQLIEMPSSQTDIDKNAILNYALTNKMEVMSTASGIYYTILDQGTGMESPTASSKITAHYKGALLNGTVFDSSFDRGEPLKFQLGQVIKGWQEAIPLLKKGGKGKFIIPSHLAYGERGAGAMIPANSVLVFDIELLDFE